MIQSFSTHSQIQEISESVLALVALKLAASELTEATDKRVLINQAEEMLKKLGMSSQKERGLIHYLKYAGEGIVKMIVYALKGDAEGVKSVAKSVTKEDMLDFLLKLDVMLFHIISQPIHWIDAILGWNLHATIKNKATSGKRMIVQTFEDAIKFIKEKLIGVRVSEEDKQRISKELDDLEQALSAVLKD